MGEDPPLLRKPKTRRGLSLLVGLLVGIGLGLLFAFIRLILLRGIFVGLGLSDAILRVSGGRRGGIYLAAGLLGSISAQAAFWWTLTGSWFFDARILIDVEFLFTLSIVTFRLRPGSSQID